MKVSEDGHQYELAHLESPGHETLTFIKRSSGAVNYGDEEHPGTNTQEVLRALIHRTEFLNNVLTALETQDAIYYLRMVIYTYEARALRRKRQKLNKHAGEHDLTRERYSDIPFSEYEIELRPVGPDGHLILTEKELEFERKEGYLQGDLVDYTSADHASVPHGSRTRSFPSSRRRGQ